MATRKENNNIRKEIARIRLLTQIQEANKIQFNDFYDCSNVNVNGNITSKVTINCPIHGNFQKRINLFIAGSGCNKCTNNKQVVTLDQWKQRANAIHNGKYDYSNITSNNFKYSTQIDVIICPSHGPFKQSLKNHITGTQVGCPKCSKEQQSQITHPKQQHLIDETLVKLNDRTWLYDQNHIHKKTLTTIATELQTTVSTIWSRFNKFNIQTKHFYVSNKEQELADFIKSLGVTIEQSNRTIIRPYELDIYLPDFNIAIEFNGNFWHTQNSGKKDKNYHKMKTQLCKAKGVALIHIFEYEWDLKQHIIKSRIENLVKQNSTRIYARNTTICQLTTADKRNFLEQNHLYGDTNSSINYGLLSRDSELIAVMTFGKSRYDKKYDYELLRFATKLHTTVVGGASKLFNHFLVNHSPIRVVSYADCKWSTGHVYNLLNFKFCGYTQQPNYVYVYPPDYVPLSRHKFQKHKLANQLNQFDPSLTEWQNMQNNGYDRIWDAGHMKWEYIGS